VNTARCARRTNGICGNRTRIPSTTSWVKAEPRGWRKVAKSLNKFKQDFDWEISIFRKSYSEGYNKFCEEKDNLNKYALEIEAREGQVKEDKQELRDAITISE
jgi:hypothetical protein